VSSINKNVLKLAFLRKVDEYVGPVACQLLLGLEKVLSLVSQPQKASPNVEVKRVLIIKYFGLGSILLASPAIQSVKKKFPNCHIAMLTLSENRDVCEIIPWIDETYLLDLKNVGRFLVNYMELLFKIRKRDFDVIVDLEFLTNFSALTSLMIGFFREKTLVGFNSPKSWRNAVYNLNISFDHSRHISKIFGKVFSSFCGNNFDISFEEERKQISSISNPDFLEELAPTEVTESGKQLKNICVNINTGVLSLNRRWPKDYFSTLVQELLNTYNIRVFLIGGKGDREYVDELIRGLPDDSRLINTCGELSIKQLVSLYSKCTLLISNDSGPLHLAYVTGLSTISFFGPETPALYGPLGENHHVFYEDLFCSPCLNIYNSKLSDCTDNVCLKNISTASVLKLIEEKNLLGPAKTVSRAESCEAYS